MPAPFQLQTPLTVAMAGAEYRVLLDQEGTFSVVLGDQTLTSSTFHDLQKQVVEARRQTRFSLPFSSLARGARLRHGAVTGFHARTGSLLVRWEDGTSAQMRAHELGDAMPRLSADDDAELTKLLAVRVAAAKAVEDFTKARKFDSLKLAAEREMQRTAGLAETVTS
jgi:hypothetical protein